MVASALPTFLEVWMWVLLVAGVLVILVALFNPWSLGNRGFEHGERWRIGKLRLGINFYARTPEGYRICMGLVGMGMILVAVLALTGS